MHVIRKQIIVPMRVRRPPSEGFSWIDRRFLREHAESLGHDAIALYLFLAAVSDKDGLSYFGDPAIAGRLRMAQSAVVEARFELERFDLIAFQAPLYQVLSLPSHGRRDQRSAYGAQSLADVFRGIGNGSVGSDSDGRR